MPAQITTFQNSFHYVLNHYFHRWKEPSVRIDTSAPYTAYFDHLSFCSDSPAIQTERPTSIRP